MQQDAHARGGRRGTPLEARMQRTGCARKDRPAVRAGWKTPAAGKAVSRRRRRRLRCRARRAPPFFRRPAACWPARGKGGAALPSRRAGSAPGNLFVQAGAVCIGDGGRGICPCAAALFDSGSKNCGFKSGDRLRARALPICAFAPGGRRAGAGDKDEPFARARREENAARRRRRLGGMQ